MVTLTFLPVPARGRSLLLVSERGSPTVWFHICHTADRHAGLLRELFPLLLFRSFGSLGGEGCSLWTQKAEKVT